MSGPNESSSDLRAVHECRYCGHRLRRDEMKTEDLVSGVIECPVCNIPGPLTIVIHSDNDRKPPRATR